MFSPLPLNNKSYSIFMSSPSFPLRNKARVSISMIIIPACRSSYGCSIQPNYIICWISFTLQPVSNNVLTFHYPHKISNLHVLLRCLFRTLFDAFLNLLENSFILFYFYIYIYIYIYILRTDRLLSPQPTRPFSETVASQDSTIEIKLQLQFHITCTTINCVNNIYIYHFDFSTRFFRKGL